MGPLLRMAGDLLRCGREAVARAETTTRQLDGGEGWPAVQVNTQLLVGLAGATRGLALCELVTRRTAELVAYQDEHYAHAYLAFVSNVRTAELLTCPDSTALTEAVAGHLYSLMAYKDEYEAARLILDQPRRPSVTNRLRPSSTRPILRVLRASRRFRGTQSDIFGYHPVRRLEREMVVLYRRQIEKRLPGLSPETLGAAVEIATLPPRMRDRREIAVSDLDREKEELAAIRAHLTGARVTEEPAEAVSP